MAVKKYIWSVMNDKAGGAADFILKPVLLLLSFVYLLAVKVIFYLRKCGVPKSAHLKAKVISVGNLTLGGTGKTPMVELIARYLSENGHKISVLTRGYGADEDRVLKNNLPGINVLAGPDRIKNGITAVKERGSDILILDDGFQHWKLARDLDILLIDAVNPFGNKSVLPRGILREPISGTSRADIIVITKTDAASSTQIDYVKDTIKLFNSRALVVMSLHKPVSFTAGFASKENLPLKWFKAREAIVVSAIGDPGYFLKMLKFLGVEIKADLSYRDHYPYNFQDIKQIYDVCRKLGVNNIITTEKDAVKLKPLIDSFRQDDFKPQFYVLGIEMELTENKDKFFQRLAG